LVAVAGLLAGCSSGSGDDKTKTNAGTLLAAGLQAQKAGDTQAAKQLYQQVIAKDPSNVYAHYNLGVIAQQAKDNSTALREYGAALAANPRYVPALYNEATIYGDSNPALAITTYQQVISLQKQSPTAYLNLGLLEVKSGQKQKGYADLLTALHQDPSLAAGLPPKLKRQLSQASKSGQGNSTQPSPSPSAS
jgi:tetratricopeptide (TPR) repeat protein